MKKLDSIGMNVFAGCLDKDGVGAIGLKNSCSDRYTLIQRKQKMIMEEKYLVSSVMGRPPDKSAY